jgi:hypothetical protein
MLPFVMLPRPLQESNVIGKGGSAGFLGAANDPYYMFQDPNSPLKTEDLALRRNRAITPWSELSNVSRFVEHERQSVRIGERQSTRLPSDFDFARRSSVVAQASRPVV